MITNRLVALIRVKPLHKSLLSMVNQQRFLASPTKVLLLEDKQRNKEADTVEKRQLEIEEERLKREIKTAQQSTQSVLVQSLPSQLTPYIELMRLDKPKPVLLVYWPSIWGILGATSYLNLHTPDFYLMGLFFVGAMFTRASGCIMNDLWDRRLDKKVERTQTRPLASGRVGVPAALALLAGNLSISLACLMQLNLPTQILGACALFPIAMYPTAKRFTNWPQLILGTTFGWGSLMGWSAVIFSQGAAASSLAHMNILEFLPALFAYAGSVAWITMYDTIYGFQDIKFDRENGIRSASIHLEKRLKSSLFGLSALSLANLALFGALTHQEPIYYISLGAVALHFVKHILFLDPKSPKSALKQFNSNNTVGALVTFGLFASIFIK